MYLHIPPNSFFIPSYTPTYIKKLNIGKMPANIRPKNGHNSGPRASPRARIWHAPSISPEVLPWPKGHNLSKLTVLKGFWRVIKAHNPINRVAYYS